MSEKEIKGETEDELKEPSWNIIRLWHLEYPVDFKDIST